MIKVILSGYGKMGHMVEQELIKRGIAKDRMTFAGFGPDKPIDTNDTPEGRANNRSVELRITSR